MLNSSIAAAIALATLLPRASVLAQAMPKDCVNAVVFRESHVVQDNMFNDAKICCTMWRNGEVPEEYQCLKEKLPKTAAPQSPYTREVANSSRLNTVASSISKIPNAWRIPQIDWMPFEPKQLFGKR